MLTVEGAREQILSRIPRLGRELVELPAGLGRVLAEPTVSCRELPPWPNSSMDGYAVRADDTRAGGVELVVVGRIIAGSLPAGTLRPGEAMRIFTGAPLPNGADAVVPQENVTADGERVTIPRPVERGAFVRPAGEDVRVGDVVVEAGETISAAEVGLLAPLGHARVRVPPPPPVALLPTGNELADLGIEPRPGQIPNPNPYSLMAHALEAGAAPPGPGGGAGPPAGRARSGPPGAGRDMGVGSRAA